MSQTSDDLRAAVRQQFATVAYSPGEEKKFPVGPASAKKLAYAPQRSKPCRRP